MKWLLVFLPFIGFSQGLMPFTDFNRFFHCFVDGYFHQVEYQNISKLTIGDELVVYLDSQNDLKVYDGKQTYKLTTQITDFKASDHLVAWKIASVISYFEKGKKEVLTSFGTEFQVGDSLVVFQEDRFKTTNVAYNGKMIQLYQTTGQQYMPEAVGDNILMFRDLGNIFKVFWRGQFFELGAWDGYSSIDFQAGTDMIAFNDPTSRTFAVFEDGAFLDVEDRLVSKYKVGRGFVIYEDVQGNLNYYSKGEKKRLSSFNQFWDAKDDLVVWGEANALFTLLNGEKKQVCNFQVKEYKLKNNVIAYRNPMGGVGSYIDGVNKDLTNISDVEYYINGHQVLVQLQNKSVIVRSGNELFRY